MNRALLVLLAMIATTAAVELTLLSKIAAHPAGGGDETGSIFRFFALWGSVPLVACLVAAVFLARSGRMLPMRRYAVVFGLGIVLVLVALAQYGHATPGFLLLALVGQLGLLATATWRAWRNAI
jgi:uncharacterized membrane protein